jgi:hypothetical protein
LQLVACLKCLAVSVHTMLRVQCVHVLVSAQPGSSAAPMHVLITDAAALVYTTAAAVLCLYSLHLARRETPMQLVTPMTTLALTMAKRTAWTSCIEWKHSHAHTEQRWSTG